MLQNFKWLIAQRKWDLKIDNLKAQLTSNAALWEQLAESEKREKILKQELQKCQSQIETQLKIVDRMKDDLKLVRAENLKIDGLWNSKKHEFQRVKHMEENLELLHQIDVDKVLQICSKNEHKIEQMNSYQKFTLASIES